MRNKKSYGRRGRGSAIGGPVSGHRGCGSPANGGTASAKSATRSAQDDGAQ